MSRRSERLLGKRRQSCFEYSDCDMSYGKKRKEEVRKVAQRDRRSVGAVYDEHSQIYFDAQPYIMHESRLQTAVSSTLGGAAAMPCLSYATCNSATDECSQGDRFEDAVEVLNTTDRHITLSSSTNHVVLRDNSSASQPSILSGSPHTITAVSHFKSQLCGGAPLSASRERQNPLPVFQWADSNDVWKMMERKERLSKFRKDVNLIARHVGLEPRMRSILVDWLIEVSEVYKMQRETLHLSVDYLDRYLSRTTGVKKTQLQLIGITALFIAAKTEEVYPARLSEFAYVTDGACTEEEILEQELVMLQILEWDMTSLTPVFWFSVYLQTHSLSSSQSLSSLHSLSSSSHSLSLLHSTSVDESSLRPCFSQADFVQSMRLLDVILLDVECVRFTGSVLAAAVIYHVSTERKALQLSGYRFAEIEACVRWMEPFAVTLRAQRGVEVKSFAGIRKEDAHNIQTHIVDLELLDLVYAHRARNASRKIEKVMPGCPTPPSSLKNSPLSSSSSSEDDGEGDDEAGV